MVVVDIKSVLICDAVDKAAVELLQSNGIKVIWTEHIHALCLHFADRNIANDSEYVNLLWRVG